jgi:hypothetical protein
MYVWENRSADPRLPSWLRIVCLADGMHKANGHANFDRGTRWAPGHLALVLGEVDRATGEIHPAHRNTVLDAIDKAVGLGFLAEGSNSACLIVPLHHVEMGVGNRHERCPVNHLRSAARQRLPGHQLHDASAQRPRRPGRLSGQEFSRDTEVIRGCPNHSCAALVEQARNDAEHRPVLPDQEPLDLVGCRLNDVRDPRGELTDARSVGVSLERADDAIDDSLDQVTEPWDDAMRWPDRHPNGEGRARRSRRAGDMDMVASETQPHLFECSCPQP